MNILIIGPEFCYTKLVLCIFDMNKNVKSIDYLITNNLSLHLEKIKNFDKVIFISREENCLNILNKNGNNGIKNINEEISKLSDDEKFYKNIFFFSIETFLSYNKFYLHKIFKQLNIEDLSYIYKFVGNYSTTKVISNKNFTLDFKIYNFNKKFFYKDI
tara:strand:- start:16 stop:492 length:477 start_codon:yes stop_codon:yes gene_type:complete